MEPPASIIIHEPHISSLVPPATSPMACPALQKPDPPSNRRGIIEYNDNNEPRFTWVADSGSSSPESLSSSYDDDATEVEDAMEDATEDVVALKDPDIAELSTPTAPPPPSWYHAVKGFHIPPTPFADTGIYMNTRYPKQIWVEASTGIATTKPEMRGIDGSRIPPVHPMPQLPSYMTPRPPPDLPRPSDCGPDDPRLRRTGIARWWLEGKDMPAGWTPEWEEEDERRERAAKFKQSIIPTLKPPDELKPRPRRRCRTRKHSLNMEDPLWDCNAKDHALRNKLTMQPTKPVGLAQQRVRRRSDGKVQEGASWDIIVPPSLTPLKLTEAVEGRPYQMDESSEDTDDNELYAPGSPVIRPVINGEGVTPAMVTDSVPPDPKTTAQDGGKLTERLNPGDTSHRLVPSLSLQKAATSKVPVAKVHMVPPAHPSALIPSVVQSNKPPSQHPNNSPQQRRMVPSKPRAVAQHSEVIRIGALKNAALMQRGASASSTAPILTKARMSASSHHKNVPEKKRTILPSSSSAESQLDEARRIEALKKAALTRQRALATSGPTNTCMPTNPNPRNTSISGISSKANNPMKLFTQHPSASKDIGWSPVVGRNEVPPALATPRQSKIPRRAGPTNSTSGRNARTPRNVMSVPDLQGISSKTPSNQLSTAEKKVLWDEEVAKQEAWAASDPAEYRRALIAFGLDLPELGGRPKPDHTGGHRKKPTRPIAEEEIGIPAFFPQVRGQPQLQPSSGPFPIGGPGWKIPHVPTVGSAPPDRTPSAQLPPMGLFATGSGAVSVHQTLHAPATIGRQAPQCMSVEASSANYPGRGISHTPAMDGANPNHTVPSPPLLTRDRGCPPPATEGALLRPRTASEPRHVTIADGQLSKTPSSWGLRPHLPELVRLSPIEQLAAVCETAERLAAPVIVRDTPESRPEAGPVEGIFKISPASNPPEEPAQRSLVGIEYNSYDSEEEPADGPGPLVGDDQFASAPDISPANTRISATPTPQRQKSTKDGQIANSLTVPRPPLMRRASVKRQASPPNNDPVKRRATGRSAAGIAPSRARGRYNASGAYAGRDKGSATEDMSLPQQQPVKRGGLNVRRSLRNAKARAAAVVSR